MERLYFAYGSNLDRARLGARIGRFSVRAAALLEGYRLSFNKLGRDGSGKANLTTDPRAHVWGVVYEVERSAWRELDRFEAGYDRVAVEPELGDGSRILAQTYVSARLVSSPPFAWYKALVLDGARDHRLPEAWLAWLAGLPSRPDPSCEI